MGQNGPRTRPWWVPATPSGPIAYPPGLGLAHTRPPRTRCAKQVSTEPRDAQEKRRRSGVVTRKLRLLRAHGLLHKVPKTHRYLVSDNGRKAITALLAARDANADLLTTLAA